MNGEKPEIPSATVLWKGANWMERETYDFYGVRFLGHPDLNRILNVDDMEVFPMRKEYPLEDPNRVDKKDYFLDDRNNIMADPITRITNNAPVYNDNDPQDDLITLNLGPTHPA